MTHSTPYVSLNSGFFLKNVFENIMYYTIQYNYSYNEYDVQVNIAKPFQIHLLITLSLSINSKSSC